MLLATLATSCASKSNVLSASEAAAQVGSIVTVCDVVADVRLDQNSAGPLYLDLGHPSPNQDLTIVIQNREGIGELRYLGYRVCVSGTVEATGGDQARPRLATRSPAQLRLEGSRPVAVDVATALDQVGSVVTACGQVVSYREEPSSELRGYLDLTGSVPQARITIILEDRRQLPGAGSYLGKEACVTGYLASGHEIRLRDPREFVLR